MIECAKCHAPVSVGYMCDEDPSDPLCGSCFARLPCRTEHDESCETAVHDSDMRGGPGVNTTGG